MAARFICDGMLGRLCNLLRIGGIDTLYSNKGMKVLIEAKRQDRIILTKNSRLKNREGVFFIESDNPSVQFIAVIERYHLRDKLRPFSRCLECNEILSAVNKKEIRDEVPYYTYKNFDEFARCPNCKRVYWKGSHYKRMMSKINSILGEFQKPKLGASKC